jgi:DNA replication protein DnaD
MKEKRTESNFYIYDLYLIIVNFNLKNKFEINRAKSDARFFISELTGLSDQTIKNIITATKKMIANKTEQANHINILPRIKYIKSILQQIVND